MLKKIAKSSPNVRQSFSDRTRFEGFQSAAYSFFYNRFYWVTFFGHKALARISLTAPGGFGLFD